MYKYLKNIPLVELDNWSLSHLLKNDFNFNKKYNIIKLNQVLSKTAMEWVNIEDDTEYPILGIRSQGQGVYLNRISLGKELTMKKYQKSKINHLFYCKVRTVKGQWGIVDSKYKNSYGSSNMQYLKINFDSLVPKYLELLLKVKSLTNSWDKNAIGADGRHFNLSTLLNLKIPLPKLEEQNKLLKKYNTKIFLAEKQEKEAKEIEESIETFFNREIGIQKNIINNSENKSLLTIIDYFNIEKWGVDKLNVNQSITYIKNYTQKNIQAIATVSSGGTPSRSNKEYYTGKIPWIKTGEVVNDIILDTQEHITQDAIRNSSAKIYPKGSLIVAMYGQGLTRGRTAKLGVDATTNQACAVLSNIDNKLINTDYLWFYLMNEYHRLRELASGNNQPNLNADMVKNYKVVIPSFNIQEKIVTEVTKRKEKIKQLKQEAIKNREDAIKEFEEEIFTK